MPESTLNRNPTGYTCVFCIEDRRHVARITYRTLPITLPNLNYRDPDESTDLPADPTRKAETCQWAAYSYIYACQLLNEPCRIVLKEEVHISQERRAEIEREVRFRLRNKQVLPPLQQTVRLHSPVPELREAAQAT